MGTNRTGEGGPIGDLRPPSTGECGENLKSATLGVKDGVAEEEPVGISQLRQDVIVMRCTVERSESRRPSKNI